jgi:hypothetical protein
VPFYRFWSARGAFAAAVRDALKVDRRESCYRTFGRDKSTMNMRTAIALAAGVCISAVVTAQTPPGQADAKAGSSNQTVTVTGCVAAGPNNTYTLTGAAPKNEAPLGTTATTPAGDKVAKTVTFTLTGDKAAELKSHVGHTVEVTGTESAPQANAQVNEKSAAPAGTSGTAGAGATPKVETTAQAQIVTRPLAVAAVKMVSTSCTLLNK